MQYDEQLFGSPLVPDWFLLSYGLSVFLIFTVCILGRKNNLLKRLILYLFLSHGLIFTGLIFAVLFWLVPVTRVIKTAYQPLRNSRKNAVEITFNRPVRRKELAKIIRPETAGIWIFEEPLYSTHLYRKIVFYPYRHLAAGTNYEIKLTGIRNFLNNSNVDYTYKFVIGDVSDVLGDTAYQNTNNQAAVIGSFPAGEWDGINVDTTIRIRFNQPVNKTDAQNHFSIMPPVQGTFSWDGDTLIFKPLGNLEFASQYTFYISSGIKNLSGNLSSQGYSASFKTQEETTKLTVPSYLQKYALSCEAASLRMALAYRGVDVTEDQLLQKIGFDPNGKRGNTWGNPYVGFVGNFRGKQMVNGYGVYWEPIARAANYFRYAKSFENWNIAKLTESVQKSTPVIVWISIKGRMPTIWTTPTGDKIKAVPDEHTVVVVGFTGPPNNPTQLIINDPLIGEAYWERAAFEKKWGSLSNSGVLVF